MVYRILSSILIIAFISCKKTIQANLIISNVNIVDVENMVVNSNQTIAIENGKIVSIIPHATSLEIKAETLIDGTNKYVIPGLWDMHAHTSSDSNTREILFPLFIANGVTSIRVLAADCFEPCWELDMDINQSKKLQAEVKYGKLIGPRAILGSTYIHGAEPGKSSTVQAPGTKEHGKELVHLLIDRGVDFIKIYDELPRDAYFGIAKEAKKQGITIAGHVPVAVKASEASDAGQKSIEHCCAGSLFEECSSLEEELRKQVVELVQSREPKDMNKLILEMVKSYDDVKCQAIFQKFFTNGTWFVPNLLAGEKHTRSGWQADPRLKYIPKKELKWWYNNEASTSELYGQSYPEIRQKRFKIVRDMHKAGVNLLAGSDCGIYGVFHGSGLHDELTLLVEAGLTELEVLQTATIKPAEFAQQSDSLGTIEIGKLADLVILDKNPLEDIRNTQKIDAVITNGRYLSRATIDSLLLSVETKVKSDLN